MSAPKTVFPLPEPALLPIAGHDALFPVRRIFCIGRNYRAHAAEMQAEVAEAPWFFLKSPHHLSGGGALAYPPGTGELHHEVELVAAIGADGLFGWAVGLDMTRRDLQAAAKADRLPWDAAKDFEGAAVIGAVTPAAGWDGPGGHGIRLTVNGAVRQEAPLSDMIWTVEACLAAIAALYTLQPGDLVMTGTPAGVSAVSPGDRLLAEIDGLVPLAAEVTS